MGFLDRLLGRDQQGTNASYGSRQAPYGGSQQTTQQRSPGPQDSVTGDTAADRQAIARYRYLLRTAAPEQIEQAHAEAFAQLSPDQRRQVLRELTDGLPPGEQPTSDEPAALARSATRAEMRQPGFMSSRFGGGYGGFGASLGGSLLGSIAGVVIGTAVADTLLGGFDSSPEAAESGEASADGGGGDSGDSGDSGGGDSDAGGGYDASGDAGGYDVASDGGGGWGDFGRWWRLRWRRLRWRRLRLLTAAVRRWWV